jgi:iron-sulfur cluster assembly protein
MSINLTENAIKELKRYQADQEIESDAIVRVKVEGGGCAGFQYGLSFQDGTDFNVDNDNIYEFDGIRVAVDKKSMLYLDGTTVDWIEDLSRRGFNFDNPNAVKSCGCNKSFST